ncbi:MAG: bifunctional oligoribonuclease/PAP phosphatase NrnA [Spirochaetes bacterium]|nr:bifunctional oligoribonuclease/PAP phosphatase NrnA [Spirochaetota bacterium]MBU1081530.1 bifunctional oligoribonuclease/PAP phosphatase NrnA [Spirochaetota bacterium]
MTRLIEESGVVAFLERYSTFIIVGHKEPDGDCVGSQLALASFLERRGKRVALLSSGPFTRIEIAAYGPRFASSLEPGIADADSSALIVVDCSSLSRIGAVRDSLPEGLPVAFIDHHASGEASGEVRLVDPGAPAVTYLVQGVIEAIGGAPTKEEAEFLLFGLCTDTGFFRHLDERSGQVFASVGRLAAAGASPKRAFDMMNGGKPFASRKLLGELLTRAETRYGGKLIVTSMDLDDQERYGLVGRDSDMLYQLLLTVSGMEVAVVVRQESPTDCTVGFRSRESVDVAAIAASFGGGGHRLAAGLHIPGQVKDIVQRVSLAFAPIFTEDPM